VNDILHSLTNSIEMYGELGLKSETDISQGLMNMFES
jgi:hypothetical protein